MATAKANITVTTPEITELQHLTWLVNKMNEYVSKDGTESLTDFAVWVFPEASVSDDN